MMSECPKCKSSKIYGPAHFRTIDGGVNVTIPKSGIFITHAEAKAYVCSDCGYVELYTNVEGLERVRNYLSRKK